MDLQRLILVGTAQSLDEAMVLQRPEFRAPPPCFGRDNQPIKGTGKGHGKRHQTSTTSTPSASTSSAADRNKFGQARKVYATANTSDKNAFDSDNHEPNPSNEQEPNNFEDFADGNLRAPGKLRVGVAVAGVPLVLAGLGRRNVMWKCMKC